VACLVAVGGLSYIAAMHGGLLDELLASVRFGLDP